MLSRRRESEDRPLRSGSVLNEQPTTEDDMRVKKLSALVLGVVGLALVVSAMFVLYVAFANAPVE